MKKSQKKKNENTFFRKILRLNKKILFLILFLIVLPLIVIPTIYIHQYATNRPQINFGNQNNPINASEFRNYRRSNTFDIQVTTDLSPQVDDGETFEASRWTVNFTISFRDVEFENFVNNSARIQIEGECNWQSCRSTSGQQTLSNNNPAWGATKQFNPVSPNMTVNHNMPLRPLPFIRINRPTVYVRITFETRETATSPITTHTHFYRISARQLQRNLR
ncbi:MAG: hypothetical protein FWE36_08805 [Erysipelotrichales bacterium]|nr:hypothetical protein [Erysipelotrichales bacterium]